MGHSGLCFFGASFADFVRRELIYCSRPKLMTFWQRIDIAGEGLQGRGLPIFQV